MCRQLCGKASRLLHRSMQMCLLLEVVLHLFPRTHESLDHQEGQGVQLCDSSIWKYKKTQIKWCLKKIKERKVKKKKNLAFLFNIYPTFLKHLLTVNHHQAGATPTQAVNIIKLIIISLPFQSSSSSLHKVSRPWLLLWHLNFCHTCKEYNMKI